jgi:tetratricopeptide (TPR) repeat protein
VELAPNDRKYWITLNAQISMLTEYRGRCSSGMEYHINSDKVDSRYRVPWTAISYNNLGLAYEHLGKLTQARESYRKAVETDPYLDLAWYNLALLAARQKDPFTVETALERLKAANSRLEQAVGTAIREQAHSLQPAQH